MTVLLQLVDAGFGYLVKHFMGEFQTEWLSQDGNLKK
jgi:hypothetical protein